MDIALSNSICGIMYFIPDTRLPIESMPYNYIDPEYQAQSGTLPKIPQTGPIFLWGWHHSAPIPTTTKAKYLIKKCRHGHCFQRF
jgi:hypothetical protein